jgi:hypothetical protein
LSLVAPVVKTFFGAINQVAAGGRSSPWLAAIRRMRQRPTLLIALGPARRPVSDVTCIHVDFQ